MSILQIKPCDNLFIGDGRRFDKDHSQWINSRFVPFPSVFSGAIASLMLAKNNTNRKKYLQKPDNSSSNAKKCNSKDYDAEEYNPKKHLTIKNIYLYEEKNKDIYMPAPLDIFLTDKNKIKIGRFKRIDKAYNTSVSENFSYILHSENDDKRVEDSYINRLDFSHSYIKGFNSVELINKKEIFEDSYKVGIEIENGTVKEGMLYRMDLTEFKNWKDRKWSYLVEYEIDDRWWENNECKSLGKGLLKLGGEGKLCKYQPFDKQIKINSSNIKNRDEYVKVYFSSPVIFKNNLSYPCLSNGFKVVGSSVKKPYFIGGFDVYNHEAKTMYNAVPEGAVYLIHNKNLSTFESLETEITSCIDKELQKEGFGQFELIPYNMEG